MAAAAGLARDGSVAAPAVLPGWTGGHVRTQVARNADGLARLLAGERTGVVTPQYASPEQRERDSEGGAPRPLAAQLTDLRESAAHFATAVEAMPAEAW